MGFTQVIVSSKLSHLTCEELAIMLSFETGAEP